MRSGSPAFRQTLLLIEDDAQIRRFLRQSMENEGFDVREAITLADGLVDAGTARPDLVVLDLSLPDGDGKQFVHEFRSWAQIPVLVLSARSAEGEKIAALEAGADDYLTKPFSTGELLARVRALLRRAAATREGEPATVRFGDVVVDRSRRLVSRAGQPVHLTDIEYRILLCLLGNADRVVTQRQLLTEVWGQAYLERSHYLRIHISHLRQKLEEDSARPRFILTETGVGYRFMPPANAPD